MDTKTLIEIKALINKAQAMLDAVIEAQPKQAAGKPPQPRYTQRVARRLWVSWDKLKGLGRFNVNDAWKIANGKTVLPLHRIDSFYSAMLSRWAKEGHIDLVKKGRGRFPAVYKIPN